MQIPDIMPCIGLCALAQRADRLQRSSMTSSPPDRGPNVPFPPPIPFVAGLGIAALLERLLPLPHIIPKNWTSASIGLALVALGVGFVLAGALQFRRFQTAVYPNRPATLVVDSGIYARTRNPMYVGLTFAYLGGVLLMASLWALALLYAVHAVIRKQVILREEAHLMERFPVEYAAYCAKVPRWI